MQRCLRVSSGPPEQSRWIWASCRTKLSRSAPLSVDASRNYDAVVISGGASQGAEDHVVRSIDALGKRHFWQIAIKPGRPMSFGQIGDCVVLGLPGNPVAVFVCFLIYVRPVLIRLAGDYGQSRAVSSAHISPKKKSGTTRILARKANKWPRRAASVANFPRDGSGLISSMREADGLIEVAENVGEVHLGEMVSFIPFSEFGFP